MIKKHGVYILSLLFIVVRGSSQTDLIDQKNGLFQLTPEKHARFLKIHEFQIDPKSAILSKPVKVIKHQDKIYILDLKQCKIFIFNLDGGFLNTIGQPGQGPGDLEYPIDFVIRSNEIYVINSAAKRVEVFYLNGNFKERIQLHVPQEYGFSNISHILVGNNSRIYVSYNLNKHLVDSYLETGQHDRALLDRKEPIIAPGVNIGNSSHIQFVDGEKAILHFDYFTGLFTKISLNGEIIQTFSAYDDLHKRTYKKIINDIKKDSRNPNQSGVNIEEYSLWSESACVEETGDILALLLLREKATPQKIYVSSADGLLKYVTNLDYFLDNPIVRIYLSNGQYFLITQQNQIFMAERRLP